MWKLAHFVSRTFICSCWVSPLVWPVWGCCHCSRGAAAVNQTAFRRPPNLPSPEPTLWFLPWPAAPREGTQRKDYGYVFTTHQGSLFMSGGFIRYYKCFVDYLLHHVNVLLIVYDTCHKKHHNTIIFCCYNVLWITLWCWGEYITVWH